VIISFYLQTRLQL